VADRLRIGVVGCGRILNAHLNGYKALLDAGAEDVEITAICARREEDARRFVAPGGPPPRPPAGPDPADPLNAPHVYLSELFPGVEVGVWTDAERMIDEADIDVVDITAAVAAHEPVAVHAAARGLHVMVQKPMATSVEAAQRMVDAARNAGVVLAVMEDQHHHPAMLTANWVVASGYLGDIEMALATYLASAQWSPDAIVAGTPWRHRRDEAGGGISFDLGVHFFCQLRRVCGPIESVYGAVRTFEPERVTRGPDGAVIARVEADADDAMFCHVELAGGGVAHLSASWAGHGPPTEVPGGLVVYGSRGCLRGDVLSLDGRDPVAVEEFVREHASEAELEALFPRGIRDPFARAYREFFAAIRTGGAPSYDGTEGMTDLAWSAAVVASSTERVPWSAGAVIERAQPR
jgi:predicted dehydrogenase